MAGSVVSKAARDALFLDRFQATDLPYVDIAIALIVGLLAKARASGIEMRAFGLSPHYREIFEITRLADFLAINPDEESAVRGAGGSADA